MSKHAIRPERILSAVGSTRSSVCGDVKLWIAPASSAKADVAGYYPELMNDAELNAFSVRRIEFVGNQHVRDNVLRKRFVQSQGDVFSRKLLEQSLQNFRSVGFLYPVTLNDVEARLDRENRMVDLTIYFRERGP